MENGNVTTLKVSEIKLRYFLVFLRVASEVLRVASFVLACSLTVLSTFYRNCRLFCSSSSVASSFLQLSGITVIAVIN